MNIFSLHILSDLSSSSIKLAAVILRRKRLPTKPNGAYSPLDYEVLLRPWLAEPFLKHLAVFSGPILADEDPGETLLQQSYNWSKKLAENSGHPDVDGIRGMTLVL